MAECFPTLFESSIRRLKCPPLHWVHSLGLFRGHGEERSVKGGHIFINEVPPATVELRE